ncbi:5-formyltetrahydrofolate cyclo-ligase [Aureimonas jatrophae]|uniref:5-formyltetrahydrofolate cyclo-ligase n=1 Tax=Aureimonas jatrophae TaxID=1166073 RepID=A0A1H0CHD1_9HYPH|nr:5-formyltetrahydrofolate cyclo-ligase [Aureimonas jatrophae]MBB3949231.1 5-formyltetrahydrofolate cyclo-ligase [Aureimonas jatrophae]SDN57201.1 5-formyltetrahydrofolate cyclo-ligase [Aureimonas jatrophae]
MSDGDIDARKRALRGKAMRRRDGLDPSDRSLDALAITRHVLAFLPDDGSPVAAYLAIRSEVDPALLVSLLRQAGRSVGVPAIDGHELRFRIVRDDGPLEPQGFGTRAPGSDVPEIVPSVILVPLLAFDAAGRRLGYGRGFYDRAIARARGNGRVLAVGLAFASQLVEHVPTDEHDQTLDAVVTENGVLVPTAAVSPSR